MKYRIYRSQPADGQQKYMEFNANTREEADERFEECKIKASLVWDNLRMERVVQEEITETIATSSADSRQLERD